MIAAMTINSLTLDEDSFIDQFRPKPNHLDLMASFDLGQGGCLFACAGKEWRYVLAQNPRTIWTLIEGDNGTLAIESGLHLVNRLGYLVTDTPIKAGTAYTVVLDTSP